MLKAHSRNIKTILIIGVCREITGGVYENITYKFIL
jgi:hypothetical protein